MKAAKNGRQLFTEMIDLTEENIEHDFVKHALEAIVSVKGSDIVKFFKLRKIAPNYNWNLMQKARESIARARVVSVVFQSPPNDSGFILYDDVGF